MKKLINKLLKHYMKGYKTRQLFNTVVEKITINEGFDKTYEFTLTEIEQFRREMI